MDEMRPVASNIALHYLHRWIGSEIKAIISLYGQFFGCGIRGELRQVDILPPDYSAISLVLDGPHGVFLDSADAEAFIGRSSNLELLEFRMEYGASVLVEHSPALAEP